MKLHKIDPGLHRTFRYFTGIAMVYFAILVIFTALQTGQAIAPSQIQSYINFAINGLLFGYLSWPWLRRKLGKYYLPIALISATVVPIFSNLIYLSTPEEEAQFVILRSWLLFPILVVPLVIIAWQYHFRIVLSFILFTSVIELSSLVTHIDQINFETLPILGVPLIRAFAFGVVGHIVTRLIRIQRDQERKLIQANLMLSEHARTRGQLATSRERNRLARDLHDTLAHTLSGLIVNLEAIKIMLGKTDHSHLTERINLALANTRNGLTNTRRALRDLRVKQIENLGLTMAIKSLAENAARRGDFDLKLILADSIPPLAKEISKCYYRIAQESLENIVRHAGASRVSLFLGRENNQLLLRIKDNGCGFNPVDVDSEFKHGLKGVKEHAAICRGNLLVESQPGRGTSVSLAVEISNDQNSYL